MWIISTQFPSVDGSKYSKHSIHLGENGILAISNFALKGFISENSEVIGIGSFLVASSVFFSLEVF